MTHDYTHCLDYDDKCPADCFRAKLIRDQLACPGLRVSWAFFRGGDECPLTRKRRERMKMPEYIYLRIHSADKGTTVQIEDASDVDVAEVIRCRDCRYFRYDLCGDSNGYCTRPLVRGFDCWEDDYCSRAERKEEDPG